jgi:hypothetical protein
MQSTSTHKEELMFKSTATNPYVKAVAVTASLAALAALAALGGKFRWTLDKPHTRTSRSGRPTSRPLHVSAGELPLSALLTRRCG